MDQDDNIQPQTPDSRVASTQYPIAANLWVRNVDVYSIFDHEFRSIKSAAAQSGLYLTFFGIALGMAVTIGIVLLTVDMSSPWVFATFAVGFVASILGTVFLGLKARHEYKATGSQFDYIEKRSTRRDEALLTLNE